MSIIDDIEETDTSLFESLLNRSPVDLKALRKLSRSKGGFLTNKLRARIWPKILCVNRYGIPLNLKELISQNDIYKDESAEKRMQIRVDIERSLWSVDKTIHWENMRRERRREVLSDIIVGVMSKHSDLHYFQGYHDVISVILLVLEDDCLAYLIAEKISFLYFKDFMGPDFSSLGAIMGLLWPILERADSELYDFLRSCDLEPYFITSWLIAWFSHDLKDLNVVARIFDVLFCSPPSYILYLCAAVILSQRTSILLLEADFAMVHSFISKIIENCKIDFDEVIVIADDMMYKTPPRMLQGLAEPSLRRQILANQVCMFRQKPYLWPSFGLPDWQLLLNSEDPVKPSNESDESNDKPDVNYFLFIKSATRFVDNVVANVFDGVNQIAIKYRKRVISVFNSGFGESILKNRALVWTLIGVGGGVISYSIMWRLRHVSPSLENIET